MDPGRTTPTPLDPPDPEASPLQTLDRLAAEWTGLHARPPAVLYHYTTAQGLLGMLQSGRLWATHVGFMNDPSEIRYAARLIREVLREEGGRLAGPPAPPRGWLARLLSRAEDLLCEIPEVTGWTHRLLEGVESRGEIYMACFCKAGDLLSQWQGYGAAGGGYAVGFAAREVARLERRALLRRVVYDPAAQRRIVRGWVRALLALDRELRERSAAILVHPTATGGAGGPGQAYEATRQRLLAGRTEVGGLLAEVQERFTRLLAECLICFKDPAYRQEQEWRAIRFGSGAEGEGEVRFRASGGRLIPYVELDLAADTAEGLLPVRSITYGPTLEPEAAERSLALLLGACGYRRPALAIRRSGIPFRA